MSLRLLEHWSAPQHAGRPLACLATTFTFDADFFAQDCLSRFLSLSTGTGDGDRISTIASILEEEDRLAETQVTVLADRSTRTQKRNLRWDLLPVAVPGDGLLHAKAALLLWERHCRVLLGSANLTAAGYRQQVEFGLALDLDEHCQIPRTVFIELHDELLDLVDLAPGSSEVGPKARALATLALFRQRIEAADLPAWPTAGIHIALATGRPKVNPLDRYEAVWRGGKPLRATVLSPFWDDAAPAPGIDAVRRLLTGRPAQERQLTILADISPFTGKVQGPPSLIDQGAPMSVYARPDKERRTLHAKLVLLESDTWVAAMVGSSNVTRYGLGLHPDAHRELNMWIGCELNSAEGKALRALAAKGDPIVSDAQEWETPADEDEVTGHQLPYGFVDCLLHLRPEPAATLTLDPTTLPASWRILDPAGHPLYDSAAWSAAVEPQVRVPLAPGTPLPAYLLVRWHVDGQEVESTWTANIDDRGALPPPSELREIPVHALLAALASTRPLPVAVELELRKLERVAEAGADTGLDPLTRYDKAHLMQRVRQSSLALMRLQERLARPASNLDAVRWRLHGALGPLTLAESVVRTSDEQMVNGEKQFMLAELALTIAAVDWSAVRNVDERGVITREVTTVLEQIREQTQRLPSSQDATLDQYVRDAVEEALAKCGH